MKFVILIIALVFSLVSGTYIQFVKSGLQNKIKEHMKSKLLS